MAVALNWKEYRFVRMFEQSGVLLLNEPSGFMLHLVIRHSLFNTQQYLRVPVTERQILVNV